MTTHKDRQKLDVKANEQAAISSILKHCVPLNEVWAFGSRVKGTAKPYSDLDLVVITRKNLSLSTYANLQNAFDNSDLPYKVDIVDWAATGEVFRKIIEENKLIVQLAEKGTAQQELFHDSKH